ncbi:MAG: hypothetical protein RBR28_02335 [Lentimicrobium sp.]|jgi:hypothetical protein|nr:hypothetical protein [Lentimicrobium sp.]
MEPDVRFASLNAFLETFDQPGSIVLLEGKRKVLKEDAAKLTQLGRLLVENSVHIKFRSGNATGADEFFSAGVASLNASRLEVIKPYASHRNSAMVAGENYSMDEIDLAQEAEVIYHTRQNKSMSGLVDKYLQEGRNALTIKAAYIIRDTVKVSGTRSGIKPASVALFYDDLQNPLQGGTGHTIRTCQGLKVPYCNQNSWFHWLL